MEMGDEMARWRSQDAGARFGEFLDAAIEQGPQVVTERGVEVAVLVAIGEWRRIQEDVRPGLKALLLEPGARVEDLVPDHRRLRRRKPALSTQF
jgi:prevent-host-death family protein